MTFWSTMVWWRSYSICIVTFWVVVFVSEIRSRLTFSGCKCLISLPIDSSSSWHNCVVSFLNWRWIGRQNRVDDETGFCHKMSSWHFNCNGTRVVQNILSSVISGDENFCLYSLWPEAPSNPHLQMRVQESCSPCKPPMTSVIWSCCCCMILNTVWARRSCRGTLAECSL